MHFGVCKIDRDGAQRQRCNAMLLCRLDRMAS